MIPKKGYWRDLEDKYTLVECNLDSCEGNDVCSEGYQGILCEECDLEGNFRKDGLNECNKCSGVTVTLVVIGIIIISYLLLQISNIVSVLEQANMQIYKKILRIGFNYKCESQNVHSNLFKILLFHFHILMLSQAFDSEFFSGSMYFVGGLFSNKKN